MPNLAEPLIQYLRQLEARGETHVSVDDEARLILREFFIRARDGKKTPSSRHSSPTSSPSPATQEGKPETSQSPPASPAEAPSRLVASGSTPAEQIADLKRQAETWAPAKALDSLRKTMVFSTGNPSAKIMLVGEAPGFDEERLLEPFVGKAGQKLNGILTAMGLRREQAYISNIVKYRPAMPNQTTNNRKPNAQEMAAWMPFIEAEIRIVKPEVIIALGGTAAQALLASDDPVGRMRGKFHDYQGTPLRVTYHPSYILHNDTTAEKRKIWEDMLDVMKLLEMPISEKQQAYFLPK
ncbi:MAG: uracil-DNA glycosylase [Akkermansiaceae bacterium]